MGKEVETIFRFVNDRQATNQLLRDNARIDDSLQDIDKSAERLEDAYSDMERAAIKSAKAQREMSEASIRAAREQSELFGDVASRTSQLSSAAAGLGAIGGQRLMIAADILDAVEATKLMRAELPALGQQLVTNAGGVKNLVFQLGAMALATGGLLLAYQAVTSATSESRQEAEKFIETQRRLRDVITDGLSTDEIQDNIAGLREQNERLKDDLDELIAKRDEEVKSLTRLGLVGEVIGGPFNTGVQNLNDEINSLTTTIDNNIEVINKYEEALTSEQRITGEIRDSIYDRYNAELEYQRLLETGTTDAVQNRIDAINKEIETSQQFVNELEMLDLATGGFSEDLEYFRNNIEDLTGELDVLNRVLPEIKKAQGEENGVLGQLLNGAKDLVNARRDEVASLIEAQAALGGEKIAAGAEAIAKAEQARIDAANDAENKILDITQKAADKRADLIAGTESKIADLSRDYNRQRTESEADYRASISEITSSFNEDSLRQLEDFQRDQERAQEDHRDAMLSAAGKLDAVALLDEQRNFTKEQKRAGEDFKTEQARRKKELDTRLKQEEQAFKAEQQAAFRNYRQREADLRNTLSQQLNDLRSAQAREISAIRSNEAQKIAEINNGLDRELRALTGFTQSEVQVREDHYTAMLQRLSQFVADANTVAGGLRVGGSAGGITSTVPNTPGAVGQFPAAARGFTSPLASPLAMMPPVSRSSSTVNNSAQVTNMFNGMDRLTPGQVKNVTKIVTDEILRLLA